MSEWFSLTKENEDVYMCIFRFFGVLTKMGLRRPCSSYMYYNKISSRND